MGKKVEIFEASNCTIFLHRFIFAPGMPLGFASPDHHKTGVSKLCVKKQNIFRLCVP